MTESSSTSETNTENQGFIIPQAEDTNQAGSSVISQAPNNMNIPASHEQTNSRDFVIGGGILIVLLVAFFFAKQSFTNSLVKKRVSPSKANMSGWFLFILLSTVATGAVFAALNPSKFLSLTILIPLILVAIVSAVISYKSSKA